MEQLYIEVILCINDEKVFKNCSQAAEYAKVSKQAMYAGMKRAINGKWTCGGKSWARMIIYPSNLEEVYDNE